MTRSIRLCFCASAALLAAARPLVAQSEAAGPGAVHARVFAVGSIGTDVDRLHYAGGALAQIGYRSVSLLGLGMLGRGGDYESVLGGGALAFRLFATGPLELAAFGGYGLYGEKGWSGIERDAGGLLAGAIASLRLGDVRVALAFSDLTGEYDKDDVLAPFRFHVPRLSIGLGF